MRKDNHLFSLVWFVFVLIIIICVFTLTFLLTSYLFQLFNVQIYDLYIQLINSVLGLIFIGIVLTIIKKIAIARNWVPKRDLLGQIIEALEKIAKGNFNIRLDKDLHEHQMLSELSNTINEMAQELGQMENMRQEFISNVSHEIQSPLTSIRGFAEVLENEQLSSNERQHYLTIIKQETRRLSRLSNNLLKLASLESETIKVEPVLYQLDEQLRNLILACEPQWLEKEIEIEIFLEEVYINADKNMLSQVWINLISNSIKYTPEGGNIKIYLYKQEDNIIFEITDTGIGISKKELQRIFERFYKTDKSRQPSQKGNGLGLSIAKKIIDSHQGEIEVNSNPGEGTTFTVLLPVE